MYSWALLGDSRNRDKPLWNILDDLKKRVDLRFAVHTGDVVVGSNRKDKFKEYLKRIKELPFPVYTCRGNHDINVFPSKEFGLKKWDVWEIDDYKTTDRFLMLDNSQDKFNNTQKQFIKDHLAPQNRNFLILHKPLDDVVFPDGRRNNHIMGAKSNGNKDAQWLRKIASRNNVEGICNGHYHGFSIQMMKENIMNILEGRGGAPSYGNSYFPGYTMFYMWPDAWCTQKVDVMEHKI